MAEPLEIALKTVAAFLITTLVLIPSAFATNLTKSPSSANAYAAGLEAYDSAVASKELFHPGYKQALAIWEPLVGSGHLGARYHVGILYYFGAGGVTIDQVKGFGMIRRAAEDGYPTAQAFLGLLSENGDGMFQKRGTDEALKWYSLAAEAGQCAGLKRMAKAYDDGELGVTKDAAKATALRARLPDCQKR